MGARKLFLVDDDEIFRMAAEVLIKTNGLVEEVVQLKNGLEAYDALLALENDPKALPGLMFLDINMPLMNGWELLEELKKGHHEIKKNVQIHILTSSIDSRDLVLSKTYEFIKGYITKPLTEADLNKIAEGLP